MGKRTPLYQCHVDASAKLVDFAGWDMPINYGSQIAEHEVVRKQAGLFDVSHMTVVDISGVGAKPYLQYLLANDVAKLTVPGKALYSCMLNAAGGVIDDLIAYYLSDTNFRLVINSATREKDLAWLNQQTSGFSDLQLEVRDDVAILAVQGPDAREKAMTLFDADDRAKVEALTRFQAVALDDYFVARTGYTGEDGFEIVVAQSKSVDCWNRLLDVGVVPCGLGARDTLRLESGMNLYGTDMDETTSPLVSGLSWTVVIDEHREFIGKAALQAELAGGIAEQFIGLVLLDKGVLRNGLKVITSAGAGQITSGSYSPSLAKSIAMARIPVGVSGVVEVEVRNRQLKAEIVKLPFFRAGKSTLK